MADDKNLQIQTHQPGQIAPNYGYSVSSTVHPASTNIIIAPASQTIDREGWKTGLCGCFSDPQSLLYCMFCTPCFCFNFASRLGESAAYPFFCGAHLVAASRVAMRYKHKIRGSLCDDAITSWCCPCCSVLQVYREMDRRGEPDATCC